MRKKKKHTEGKRSRYGVLRTVSAAGLLCYPAMLLFFFTLSLPCCALFPLFAYHLPCRALPYFIFTYPAVPLMFFFAPTLLCPKFFFRTHPAVLFSRFAIPLTLLCPKFFFALTLLCPFPALRFHLPCCALNVFFLHPPC